MKRHPADETADRLEDHFNEVAMDGPCDRFQLDYFTDINHWDEPTHRYCECGWTEAHHDPKGVE